MSINRCMDEEGVAYIYVYTHSTLNGILLSHKKNKILPFAATQMNADITVSEVSQTQKDKYYMISFICGI